jgi:hypothetical protein
MRFTSESDRIWEVYLGIVEESNKCSGKCEKCSIDNSCVCANTKKEKVVKQESEEQK